VSRQAKTKDSRAFPTWSELLRELETVAEGGGYISPDEKAQIDSLVARGKYLMAAQALKSELPRDVLEEFVQKRFVPPDTKPGAIHRSLFKLKPPLILMYILSCGV